MANRIHKSGELATSGSDAGSGLEISWLESIYKHYGGQIYALCPRLLADKSTAEDATVEAFVRVYKETKSPPDGSQVLPRLRELGIEASLRRLRAHSGKDINTLLPPFEHLARLHGNECNNYCHEARSWI